MSPDPLRLARALSQPAAKADYWYTVKELPDMQFLRALFPNGEASAFCLALFTCGPMSAGSMTLEEIAAEIKAPKLADPPRLNLLVLQPRLGSLWHGWLPVMEGDLRFLERVRQTSHEIITKIGFPSTRRSP